MANKKSKSGRGKKIMTAAQLQAQADEKMRRTLSEAGVPAHRLAGKGVRDFTVAPFTDIKQHRSERRQVLRVLYPHIVDRWLAEGGPGFDDPQRRAIEHCRSLWALIGSRRMTVNYTGVGGGEPDPEGQVFALAQLAQYKKDIPAAYWAVFENVLRFDMPAGEAGSAMASNTPQQQAHAKSCVGFVASLIAQWRGY
jgi:hypothetical protein